MSRPALLLAALGLALAAPSLADEPPRSWPPYFLEHQRLFTERQGVHRAGPHRVWTLHTLDGWFGNSIVIEGPGGLIVYDTGISAAQGELLAEEIRGLSPKPIRAIFYSHHHADHYNGTAALVTPEQVASGAVRIYAWENFEAEREAEWGELLPRQIMGGVYYSGALLGPEERHHHGCCGLRALGRKGGYLAPTHLLDGDRELEVAGVRLRAFHTGGSAMSQFGLHLPELDMVVIADELLYALPNLHSIRGTRYRPPENWIRALDRVLALDPAWLLGTHITPLEGREEIRAALTATRDAVQYLRDQVVRYINKGEGPQELQQRFSALPDFLDHPPWTRPMHGAPWIIAPALYTGRVSWFSGDAVELRPTPAPEKGRRMVELMGGRDRVLDAARASLEADDPQFAAELADLLLDRDPEDGAARGTKAAALRLLGYRSLNTIARSWYLTGALELEGKVPARAILTRARKQFSSRVRSLRELAGAWRFRFRAEEARDASRVLALEVPGGERLVLEVRHGVLVLDPVRPSSPPAATLRADLTTLGLLDRGELSLGEAVRAGRARIRGDRRVLLEVWGWVEREVPEIRFHSR